ncbi:MAG: hypothetical protein BMS9Abin26_0038 [Gammaproteobacteria bacterium]|nr:MAG: hypothetical protein BMS9Abin26_0038 [Gammaproteobacteria bacterium]
MTEDTRSAEELLEASAEELLGEAEPWEAWETQLVTWSIGIAIVSVVILGWLINTYILK